TNEGRMLVFPAADLPRLSKGKGNRMINISAASAAEGVELMVSVQALQTTDTLLVYSGKRHLKMKFSDLEHYFGERGRRGNKLPRGFQNVDRLELLSPQG
ncbi:hypothetical protein Q4595_23055, partial [Wenyingzhuangia sp. 1_MG-2023]|nr:hypothetical protein [Wenyingzhuangia sp. 1_MG-2023]